MKTIILAGGSGNIGKKLSSYLKLNGYNVLILSRKATQKGQLQWDGKSLGDWVNQLENAYAIINLSGKSIQTRFTEKNKKELTDSRLKPTFILGKAIERLKNPPKFWINFSGISLFEGVKSFNDEYSINTGKGFLCELVKQWEEVFFSFETASTYKVCLRLSPVLSNDFGMFKELYPLSKWGLGGKVGDGKQYISWIHEEDLLRMIVWILNQEKPQNIYHACVPVPSTNAEFMKALQEVIGINFGLPLPSSLAKIGALFKGVESSMLLETNNVGTVATIQNGFSFNYSKPIEAFKTLIY